MIYDEQTMAALKDSIAHWRRMEEGESDNESPSGRHCALCKTFVKKNNSCWGCPVMSATGLESCQGSPWLDANEKFHQYGMKRKEFIDAARKEREFLESLLPQ